MESWVDLDHRELMKQTSEKKVVRGDDEVAFSELMGVSEPLVVLKAIMKLIVDLHCPLGCVLSQIKE